MPRPKRFQRGPKRRTPQRKGFVLLYVLMTLLLVSALVVGFSSHSMKVAAEALVKQQEMQSRWASISSQRVLMQNTGELLRLSASQNPGENGPQESTAAVQFRVGNTSFVGLIQDESAKLDLNLYSQLANQQQVQEVAESLLNTRKSNLQFDVIDDSFLSNEVMSAKLIAWDQVLQNPNGFALAPAELIVETKQLTLWGGKLHFRSASDLVLRESITALVGPIMASRVIAIREDQPDLSWTDAKQQLNMTEQQTNKLDQLIGNQSRCHSLWLIARTGNVDQYSLLVRRKFADAVVRYYSYYW